jgi:hypothetical protein
VALGRDERARRRRSGARRFGDASDRELAAALGEIKLVDVLSAAVVVAGILAETISPSGIR